VYTNKQADRGGRLRDPVRSSTEYDILPISLGTDPDLTLKTRRGTGYYEVPSLKDVWYRSVFGYSSWCATLEDWFDPRPPSDDHVPAGWKPYDRETYTVKGHRYELSLSETDSTRSDRVPQDLVLTVRQAIRFTVAK
jgi:hypothetical protein